MTVIIVVLLAFCTTMILPATPASAASLSDLLTQTTGVNNQSSSSGKGLIDILVGLLLGKFLGNLGNSNSSQLPDISKVLGLSADSSSQDKGASKNIIDTAQKYMGVPYVWGGETPAGFDCSGFTQYVMKQHGIAIPRTAAEQFAAGKAVDKANLQVGDLVFFTTYKPGASHVGFYMGDGNFIHASSAGGQVTINALDTPYYTEHYIGARRYTK